MDFDVKGLVAPVFTPVHPDFTVNYNIIPQYMQFLVEANITSILVNGTTGEGMSQSVEERQKVAKAWVKAAKPHGVHVMVQVGGASLPDVLQLASHAESIKANSILTLPELYFKPRNTAEVVSYLDLVSKAAPNLPILFYHFPMQSGVEVNVPQLVSEANKRILNFKGLKCNLSEGAEVLLRENNISVFLGSSFILAPAVLSGLDCSIATLVNLMPGLCSEILESAKRGQVKNANILQKKLNRFTDILTSEGDWVPATKMGMELVTGLNVGPPRSPLTPLTQEHRNRLKKKLSAAGFLT